MGTVDRTKQQLAAQLKQMAATMPFRKVRVGDLCENCGIDRRTFYYHFRDIYDLAAWIYSQNVEELLTDENGRPCEAGMLRVLTRIREEEYFYRSALGEDSQNALGRFILRYNVEMYERELRKLLSVQELSREDSFAVGYHCFASLGMIRRWIYHQSYLEPCEMARLLIHTMPPKLRVFYQTPGAAELKEENHE